MKVNRISVNLSLSARITVEGESIKRAALLEKKSHDVVDILNFCNYNIIGQIF